MRRSPFFASAVPDPVGADIIYLSQVSTLVANTSSDQEVMPRELRQPEPIEQRGAVRYACAHVIPRA
jgi:hypothetical protein